MARLRSDSPLAKQIVRSFLHFLNSVEITPDVDTEAVLVVSQCLGDAFAVDIVNPDDSLPLDLVQLFEKSHSDIFTRELHSQSGAEASPCKPSVLNDQGAGPSHDRAGPSHDRNDGFTLSGGGGGAGHMEDKLFEQFKEGLKSAGVFDGVQDGSSKFRELLESSKRIFREVLKKLKKPGISEEDILAEAYKTQGNSYMSDSQFNKAIDLYTMAISMCGDNAVYYSNRAAAHTHIGKYEAAIADSTKAIELDPEYSKAYSRLGLAYYSQGKYKEAIEKGFTKALQLDPNSKSIQENMQAALKKFGEQQTYSRQSGHEQQQQPNANNRQGLAVMVYGWEIVVHSR
ncbi:hypothetical protein KP509_1Z118100 [Ceratopteris richardii]|nr:hypothetical protein KP509_1Z118100 [Ceratopteris richardii]